MMLKNYVLLSLVFAPPAIFASASQYVSNVTCNFTFSLGDLPEFRLPEAGPNSPGDIQLNEGNPIVTLQNNNVSSCNGESAAFFIGNDTWNTTFINNDGNEYNIDAFYITFDDELWVRTLQPHMDPSLYDVLNDTTIRLNITCGVSTTSCLEFTANFTDMIPYNYTAPFEFNDTCYHGFSIGERIPSVTVPAAYPEGPSIPSWFGSNYTLVLAGKADQGLPWSEGFGDGGERKDDKFWVNWWDQINSDDDANSTDSDNDSDSDSDSNDYKRRRRHYNDDDGEDFCTGYASEVWNTITGKWKQTFETIDGTSHGIDIFFVEETGGSSQLGVTKIEDWMAPSIYNQLQFNYVKIKLTCPSSVQVDSCVIFSPRFTNWSPAFNGATAGYRFSDPAVPSFNIPEAAPNSPGEVLLTSGNEILTKIGEPTETLCNGDEAEYHGEDNIWYKKFIMTDGRVHELKHIFYPKGRNLYAATIQENWEPNLSALLNNRNVRVRVWCSNDEKAEYMYFRINGNTSTCDDIDKLCEGVSTSGTTGISPVLGQCATILLALYLGWLFASI